jgi:hypothetical protein
MDSHTLYPSIHSTRHPEVKATTGITYDNFSKILEKLVRPADGDKPETYERFNYVMNQLHSAVRLRQWECEPKESPVAFQIWNQKKSVCVIVTEKFVDILSDFQTPTLPTHSYRVAEGLDAESFFHKIKHAQEQIYNTLANIGAALPSNAPVWQRKGVEDPDEEADFFEPITSLEQGEALDPVLDTPQNLDAVFEINGQSAKVNKIAAQEAQDIQDEYLDKADPKKDVRIDEARAHKHIKSLQGRVLTIVDATLADKQQREAVKQLMNKEFRREMKKISDYFADPDAGESAE